MLILVSLSFNNGDFTSGFKVIGLSVGIAETQQPAKIELQLPPAPNIPNLYQSWQNTYINFFKSLGIRILPPRSVVTSFDFDPEDFPRGFNKKIPTNLSSFEKSKQECDSEALLEEAERYASELRAQVNEWLAKTKSQLKTQFQLDENSQILLQIYTQNITSQQTKDILHRLPWQEWDYFQEGSDLGVEVEVVLCLSEFESSSPEVKDDGKFRRVKVTSIFGDSQNINVASDKELIAKLEKRGAELINLEQPQRQDFRKLWDEPCDILFYSGHSETSDDGTVGSLQINSTDSLNLQEIRNTLGEAVKQGLKLAIFNSCDGLGLAKQLADLHLPYIIVWREPVPDKTAIGFIEHFLSSYAEGKSLFNSVRDARLKLVELSSSSEREKQIPGLKWLPIICKNTSDPPPTWEDLGGLTGKLPDSPYKGLSAFREEDAAIFFGRDRFIRDLVKSVNTKPLVGVVGASGSGKSSVVFAGLVPQLRGTDKVHIVSFRPGRNPFDALAVALSSYLLSLDLSSLLESEEEQQQQEEEEIEANNRRLKELELEVDLRENRQTLCRFVENVVDCGEISPESMINGQIPHQRFVLIADQFEEIYTLTSEEQRQPFLDTLLYAVRHAPCFSVVFTLRADFMGKALIDYKPMGEALQKYPPILLTSMDRVELTAAIEEPAHKMKVEFQEGLTNKLIDDLGDRPGRLPLLEFTLLQLWEKHDKWYLTHKAYEEIGGLEKALARYADSILNPLSAANQEKAERIFIQLIRPGEGTEDTKRKATRAEVGEDNWDLVEDLANKRLLVTAWDESNQEKTVEIIHEALIREWGMLREWIQSNRQFRIWQERLQFTVAKWKEKKRDTEYLLSGGALGEADGWYFDEKYREYLSDTQAEFIRESLDARDRKIKEEKRKQKQTLLGFAGFSIVSLVIAGFAGLNWLNTEINATKIKIDSLSNRSEYFFGLQKYEDALIEAIKGNELLEKTWWRKWIPTGTQQQVKVTQHNAIHNSIALEQDTLTGHQSIVWDVEFSPDGKTIASASGDKTVKLWNWNFDDLVTRGCNKFKGYLVAHPEEKLEKLKPCQNPQILTIAASNLVIQGENLGQNDDFEGAVGKFTKAKAWNPKLNFNPESKAKAITLVAQGRKLAGKGDLKSATEKFKRAQQLHPSVNLEPYRIGKPDKDPKLVAEKLTAQYFVEQGRELASQKGDLNGAVDKFKQAQQLHANVDLEPYREKSDKDPKLVAGKLTAQYLVRKGRESAEQKGDLNGAVDKFKQAQQLHPNVDLEPYREKSDKEPKSKDPKLVAGKLTAQYLVTQGQTLVRKGEVKEAISRYNKALKVYPQISAYDWDRICWYGILHNHPQDVMFACDKAVNLALKDITLKDKDVYEYAMSNRGIARVLTGDTQGAIEDFEAFIKHNNNTKEILRRRSWINDLRKEKNPITPEVLEEWRKQEGI